VRPARLERATYSFGGCHSIQLSYGRSAAEYKAKRAEAKCRNLQFRLSRWKMPARQPEKTMSPIIDAIEKEQLKTDVTKFKVGDGIRVHTRVREGDKERIQIFAGIVIGRKGRGINETFTVRRISYGEGVERVFPIHSPRIAKVEVEKAGKARRAKLNYLRDRKGKEATAVRE
jgi:large subunit ribosomal protein L19